MNLRRLNAVARKESLHLIRDWRSLTLALAIPLILILLSVSLASWLYFISSFYIFWTHPRVFLGS